MVIEGTYRTYAPLMPRQQDDGSFKATSDTLRVNASILTGYVKIKLDVQAALHLASKCPYPESVKMAVLKQVALAHEITLEQMRVLLGFAAQKSMGYAVALRNNSPF